MAKTTKQYKYHGVRSGYTDFLLKDGTTKGFHLEPSVNPYTGVNETFGIFSVDTEAGEDKFVEQDARFKSGVIEVFDGFKVGKDGINVLGLTDEQVELIDKAKKSDPDSIKLMIENIMAIAKDRAPAPRVEVTSPETQSIEEKTVIATQPPTAIQPEAPVKTETEDKKKSK